MTEAVVLDASALLAVIFDEPRQDQSRAYLSNAVMSAVNLAEVIGKMIAKGFDPALVQTYLTGLAIEIEPFTSQDALEVAHLLPLTKQAGLSLADRACIALGRRRGLRVITADRVWQSLDLGIAISLIR